MLPGTRIRRPDLLDVPLWYLVSNIRAPSRIRTYNLRQSSANPEYKAGVLPLNYRSVKLLYHVIFWDAFAGLS